MYGKFFASAFTGSMLGSGADVFAVWGYVIANASNGQVELNPRLLAAVIGSELSKIESAISFLCSPDPSSRSKEDDGRRLVKEGEFAYRVVNHAKYRKIRNEEERREYNRVKQQESRAKRAAGVNVNASVNDGQLQSTVSAHAEAEAEAEAVPPIPPAPPPDPPLTPPPDPPLTPPPDPKRSAPPRGQAGGITEGKDSSNIPTTEQSKRVARIFHRKETTPWDAKEIAAYRKLGTIPEEDLEAVEKYYASHWPPNRDANILRHNLITFLNNFRGEVDRAKTAFTNKHANDRRTTSAQTQHRATGAENFAGRYDAPIPIWSEPPVDGEGAENPQPTPDIPGLSPGTCGSAG